MTHKNLFIILASSVLILMSLDCQKKETGLETALQSITAEELSVDIQILSSDTFEGRAPASKGEELTIEFMKEEFKKIGLKPGNKGSFFQEVPMVKITADPGTRLLIRGINDEQIFQYGSEFVGVTLRVVEQSSIEESEMVFVGYGIVAPEYEWNDYQGLDVKGKTVVVLVNDPGYATENPDLFNGRTMTYYGRWTYKYEEAARQGAAGVLIIHETAPAAYGWDVVEKGWTGPQFNLISEDKNMARCAVEGWISQLSSQKIFDMAGMDLEKLKSQAVIKGFQAIPMGLKASVTLKNSIKPSISNNVLALFPGTGQADEYLIYMAHWDHFGQDTSLEGDQIFNGALDNATGTAALLELAEAFSIIEPPPQRSILFMAVAAEEQGLLGSHYYATHPVYPPTKTSAAINMDALNIYGKMNDITIIGFGQSELDTYAAEEAEKVGRRVRPDPKPERGSFYRSDHFPFAKQGIPALYLSAGIDHVEYGEQWTLAQRDKYIIDKYHKPTDEFDPNWDLSGAIEDLRLLFKIGYRLSRESTFPNWKEGSEFKAKRDADMQQIHAR